MQKISLSPPTQGWRHWTCPCLPPVLQKTPGIWQSATWGRCGDRNSISPVLPWHQRSAEPFPSKSPHTPALWFFDLVKDAEDPIWWTLGGISHSSSKRNCILFPTYHKSTAPFCIFWISEPSAALCCSIWRAQQRLEVSRIIYNPNKEGGGEKRPINLP